MQYLRWKPFVAGESSSTPVGNSGEEMQSIPKKFLKTWYNNWEEVSQEHPQNLREHVQQKYWGIFR
jgi:hypothetical protein